MSVIDREQAIKGTVLLVRDVLTNNITDPLSSRRTTGKFVMTSWPTRETVMPLITVNQQGWQSQYLGTSTDNTIAKIGVEINVWTQNASVRDSLAGSAITVLEQQRNLIIGSGLHDFRINNATDLDEEGAQGVHRKLIEVSYLYPSQ